MVLRPRLAAVSDPGPAQWAGLYPALPAPAGTLSVL